MWNNPIRVSKFTNSISGSVTLQWSVITLISTSLTIRLHQSKTDPFHKRHTVYILATNISACSFRASLKLKEVIPPTVRNGPVVFNLTIFTTVADTCNKHSTLLTIANSSQFKLRILQSHFFAFKRLQPQPQQVFSALADQGIKGLKQQCLYDLHSFPSSHFTDIYCTTTLTMTNATSTQPGI